MGIVRIDTADDPRLDVYARLTERQLRSRLERNASILVAESEKVVRVALASGVAPLSLLLEERQLETEANLVADVLSLANGGEVRESAGHVTIVPTPDVPIYVLSHDQICRLVGYNVTRGVLCAMRRPAERSAAALLDELPDARRLAVLEGVTDATNVGAAMRSAAALGIDAVLLTPTCCDPLVRRAVRVSMGTVFQVPWARFGSWPAEQGRTDGIGLLRARGFKTAALALRDDSYSLGDERLRGIDRLAMLFGTEGDGLANSTIEACDVTVRIPMQHGVDSLNVAAATAVAFWELCH
ncbi:RNA methyltransferase [uncultured Parolsenella sp.]|uniref:TrmH family RNA methyltransferase n=1 Tax=uncultured Parolsenella sp. TaxID=2083008 RepID=UPI0025E9DA88|nr:RNA methyltransferase [uncultured Parolsenella sp.]